jgi:YfiH family protein
VNRAPLRHPLLEGCGVEHGFGMRGASDPGGVRRPVQVHGAGVATAEQCAAPNRVRADAVVSTAPGVRIGIVTADCLPVLLAAEDGTAVAAIHAGWRGLAQGVIEAGVAALQSRAKSDLGGRSRILAAIGPHVGPCCYEVDEPVLAALMPRFDAALDAALRPTRSGHALLDLGRLACQALLAAGLAPTGVGVLCSACTACDPGRFHSYRRDGSRAGRLLHFISASPGEP